MQDNFLTIIVTGMSVAGFIYMLLRNFKEDVDQRFERMDAKFDVSNEKLDGWIKHSISMQAEQAKRTDKLYEMYVDTQKEIKQLYIQNTQKK